jgi:hypothetical protein
LIITVQTINLLFLPHYLAFSKIEWINFCNEQPLTIKIIWILTVFFLFLFLVFFFTLIFSRIIKNIQGKNAETLKKKFQDSFSFYLFDESMQDISLKNDNSAIVELFGGRNLKKAFDRKVLYEQIIKLHNNYSGEFSHKLEKLFVIIGFDKDVEKKIVSRHWNVKANGIKDAAQMNLMHNSKYILNLINHPDSTLRTEARVALIKLNREDPFVFFNDIKFNISNWDLIRIFEALTVYEKSEIPLMGKWLSSSNESIVVFSLKIIGYYGQEEEIRSVIKCLDIQSEVIKIQAIKTLGELGSKESLFVLFDCLKNEKNNKKLLIEALQSLKLIGIFDEDVVLIKELLHINDYEIIFSSCLTIKSAPNGKKILEEKILESDDSIVEIMRYALAYTN